MTAFYIATNSKLKLVEKDWSPNLQQPVKKDSPDSGFVCIPHYTCQHSLEMSHFLNQQQNTQLTRKSKTTRAQLEHIIVGNFHACISCSTWSLLDCSLASDHGLPYCLAPSPEMIHHQFSCCPCRRSRLHTRSVGLCPVHIRNHSEPANNIFNTRVRTKN